MFEWTDTLTHTHTRTQPNEAFTQFEYKEAVRRWNEIAIPPFSSDRTQTERSPANNSGLRKALRSRRHSKIYAKLISIEFYTLNNSSSFYEQVRAHREDVRGWGADLWDDAAMTTMNGKYVGIDGAQRWNDLCMNALRFTDELHMRSILHLNDFARVIPTRRTSASTVTSTSGVSVASFQHFNLPGWNAINSMGLSQQVCHRRGGVCRMHNTWDAHYRAARI